LLSVDAESLGAGAGRLQAAELRLGLVEIARQLAAGIRLGELGHLLLRAREHLVGRGPLIAQGIGECRSLGIDEPGGGAALLLQLVHEIGDDGRRRGDRRDALSAGERNLLLQQRLAGKHGECDQRKQAGDRDTQRNSQIVEPQ